MTTFYFSDFPEIVYNHKTIKNIMLRFEIRTIIENRTAIYYNYQVQNGERPHVIAEKYYGDGRLDWLILLINGIFDIEYEWSMSQENLDNFIRSKYGSMSNAKSKIHHYEKILQPHKKLFDGTIVHERSVEVDKTTYDSLSPSIRKEITSYDYEVGRNLEKANIKLLDEKYASSVMKEVEGAFVDG